MRGLIDKAPGGDYKYDAGIAPLTASPRNTNIVALKLAEIIVRHGRIRNHNRWRSIQSK